MSDYTRNRTGGATNSPYLSDQQLQQLLQRQQQIQQMQQQQLAQQSLPYPSQLLSTAVPSLPLSGPSTNPTPRMATDYGRNEDNNQPAASNGEGSGDGGNPFEYLYYPIQSSQRQKLELKYTMSSSGVHSGHGAPSPFQPQLPRVDEQHQQQQYQQQQYQQQQYQQQQYQQQQYQQQQNQQNQQLSWPSHQLRRPFPLPQNSERENKSKSDDKGKGKAQRDVNPPRLANATGPVNSTGPDNPTRAGNSARGGKRQPPPRSKPSKYSVVARSTDQYMQSLPLPITHEERVKKQREMNEKAEEFDSDDDKLFYPGPWKRPHGCSGR
ncbi:tyrosine protein phosphatase yvh1 [Hypoxylon texense]